VALPQEVREGLTAVVAHRSWEGPVGGYGCQFASGYCRMEHSGRERTIGMTFDEVALAVMRKAWPDYTIEFVADVGAWVARYIYDGLSPVMTADSPEALTSLLSDDASHRRRGDDTAPALQGHPGYLIGRCQPDDASSAATACSAAESTGSWAGCGGIPTRVPDW
jgi:hypothetical protein